MAFFKFENYILNSNRISGLNKFAKFYRERSQQVSFFLPKDLAGLINEYVGMRFIETEKKESEEKQENTDIDEDAQQNQMLADAYDFSDDGPHRLDMKENE